MQMGNRRQGGRRDWGNRKRKEARKGKLEKKKETSNSRLNLLPDLHSRVSAHLALVAAKTELLLADSARPLGQGRDGHEIEVAGEGPEEGAADAHGRAVGELGAAAREGRQRRVADHDLVEAGLHEAAGQVLELLARLHEQVVPGGDGDGDPPPRVPRPHVQPRVPAAAVDREEVEVRVEAREDRVLGAVLV